MTITEGGGRWRGEGRGGGIYIDTTGCVDQNARSGK